MKKILFFIAMVAMIAAMASAQIEVTVSGSATTSFGIDLDAADTGFEYSGSADISIAPEIDKDSAASAVEDGDTVYGEFSINGISLTANYPQTKDFVSNIYDDDGNLVVDNSGANFRTDSNYLTLKYDSIAAKIVLGDLTINLYDAPGLGVDYCNGISTAYTYSIFDGKYGNEGSTYSSVGVGDDPSDDIEANAGIELVYAIPDIATITVDFKSHDSWTDQTFENEYAMKAKLGVTAVDGLTLEAAMNMALSYESDEYMAIGAKLGYDIAIGEEDSITPAVNVEYKTDGDGELGVEGGITANVAGIKATAIAAYRDLNLGVDDDDVFGYSVALDFGLVEGLTLQAALFQDFAVIATVDVASMEIHGKIGYDIAAGDITISPSAQASYADPTITDPATEDDEELYAKISVGVSGLIDNVDFTLSWDSNDLLENDTKTAVEGPMGQVVLATKVSL